MAKIIAIVNHKGGVGKTTTTVNSGAALALQGKRVLLVDMDSQQNLTTSLMREEDVTESIYDSLMKGSALLLSGLRNGWTFARRSLRWQRQSFTCRLASDVRDC